MFAKFGGGLKANPRRKWVLVTAVAVVVAAGVAIGVVTSSHPTKSATSPPPTSSSSPSTTTTTGLTVPAGYCPLTDVRAAQGVPVRPALAVKIGNEPQGARPQSGLNEADIVFDTPAEGFVMRYVAVYQCTDAVQIGPNRSVRWVDWHLIRQFIHPVFAYAGGIGHDLKIVKSFKWVANEDLLGNAYTAGVRSSARVPPDNLYTSTSRLYGLSSAFDKQYGPPPPIFRYSSTLPAGSTPAASMHINFSYDTDVTWRWDPTIASWLHSYGSGPDIDTLTNTQVNTKNVVVLVVHYHFGPYAEHVGGSGDFDSQTLGNGTGYILRDGRAIKITWSRRYITQPWTFVGPNHEIVGLAPGRTWVELVPNTTAAAPGALGITP